MKVIIWFIWYRWFFMIWAAEYATLGYSPGNRFEKLLSPLHNNNVFGCRSHPVIYKDICRICGVKNELR